MKMRYLFITLLFLLLISCGPQESENDWIQDEVNHAIIELQEEVERLKIEVEALKRQSSQNKYRENRYIQGFKEASEKFKQTDSHKNFRDYLDSEIKKLDTYTKEIERTLILK
jgi:uncharacterized protein YllA (UPF0747 family)